MYPVDKQFNAFKSLFYCKRRWWMQNETALPVMMAIFSYSEEEHTVLMGIILKRRIETIMEIKEWIHRDTSVWAMQWALWREEKLYQKKRWNKTKNRKAYLRNFHYHSSKAVCNEFQNPSKILGPNQMQYLNGFLKLMAWSFDVGNSEFNPFSYLLFVL